MKRTVFDLPSFLSKAHDVHGLLYDYTKSVYISAKTKMIIKCKTHGEFLQTPYKHLFGQGCPKCCGRISKEELISKLNTIHNNQYDYDKVQYSNVQDRIIIGCKKHGDFKQKVRSHLRGSGCPGCRESIGEKKVAEALTALKVSFQRQFKDERCKSIKPLPFDFKIQIGERWGLIEYNGKQHYKKCFEDLEQIQARDAIKTEFCLKYQVPFLVINYKDFSKVEEILWRWIDELRYGKH